MQQPPGQPHGRYDAGARRVRSIAPTCVFATATTHERPLDDASTSISDRLTTLRARALNDIRCTVVVSATVGRGHARKLTARTDSKVGSACSASMNADSLQLGSWRAQQASNRCAGNTKHTHVCFCN